MRHARESGWRIALATLVLALPGASLAAPPPVGPVAMFRPALDPSLALARSALLALLPRLDGQVPPPEQAFLAARIASAPDRASLDAARREVESLLVPVPAAMAPTALRVAPGPGLRPVASGDGTRLMGGLGHVTIDARCGRGVWMPSPDAD